MTPAATIRLVADREVRQRLRGKAFAATTAILLAVILATGVIQRIAAGDDGPRSVSIGMVGATSPVLEEQFVTGGAVVDLEIDIVPQPHASAARHALDQGELDAVFDIEAGHVLYPDQEDEALHAVLQQAWSTDAVRVALREAGLSDAQIDQALQPQPLESGVVDDADDDAVAMVVSWMVTLLLFVSLQTFGGYVLMGVVEEKSTAVIEVLLARAPATHLLAGKVLGIGLVALLQFLLALAAGFVALNIADVTVPTAVWASLPWAVVWFVAGFALYCTLFGLAGSFVSRQEDAQAAVMPIGTTFLVAYLSVFLFLGDPASLGARIVSVLPPFAPMLMPMRIATGSASVVELAVSLVAITLAIIGVAKLSGAVYSQVVLHRGTRLRWMAVLRSLRTRRSAA